MNEPTDPQNRPEVPLVMLAPESIRVDAATYQFRRNGDRNGVTKHHKYNNERWDPILHGNPILVHERIDGSRYVVDGHHRLDLAKRLRAKGQGPEALAALVLREADGYSAKDARLIAAYKNMSHGHATTIESARVFKEATADDVHKEWLPQLQMDKSNLRIAYTLSGLSDQALDMVEKSHVPVEVAAQAAEIFASPDSQETILRFISDTIKQPYNPPKLPAYDIRLNVDVPGHTARLMRERANLGQLGLN